MDRRDDGYEIDTSRERLDLPRIHTWLSTDSYWATGLRYETMVASIEGATCYGLYDPDGTQIGFARVITDGAVFAYLCDVYIAREARAKGLGSWLVATITERYRAAGLRRILLATMDAHEVYARIGFTGLTYPDRWMEIFRPPARTGAPSQGNAPADAHPEARPSLG
jgi:GNAT superfamily N-acetyltransferase